MPAENARFSKFSVQRRRAVLILFMSTNFSVDLNDCSAGALFPLYIVNQKALACYKIEGLHLWMQSVKYKDEEVQEDRKKLCQNHSISFIGK